MHRQPVILPYQFNRDAGRRRRDIRPTALGGQSRNRLALSQIAEDI
jgi:hypothetical protein